MSTGYVFDSGGLEPTALQFIAWNIVYEAHKDHVDKQN